MRCSVEQQKSIHTSKEMRPSSAWGVRTTAHVIRACARCALLNSTKG